jgi:hypothetical protein
MTTATAAGLTLIAVPLAFNGAFARLAARFDYPDILRRPTSEILARFRAGGTELVLTWWAFALTAVAMVPMVVLLSAALGAGTLTTTVGVLAALVQFLGLVRWPFLVPFLAEADAAATGERREAIDIVFQSFNRYLGVAVGEHLGYALTGAWTLLASLALIQSASVWIGIAGVVIGPILILCSLEFVGRGLKLAERLTPPTYIAWSLWLIATGVTVL